jgi:hypothetical protein
MTARVRPSRGPKSELAGQPSTLQPNAASREVEGLTANAPAKQLYKLD